MRTIAPALLVLCLGLPAAAADGEPVFEDHPASWWADAMEERGDFTGFGKGIPPVPSTQMKS